MPESSATAIGPLQSHARPSHLMAEELREQRHIPALGCAVEGGGLQGRGGVVHPCRSRVQALHEACGAVVTLMTRAWRGRAPVWPATARTRQRRLALTKLPWYRPPLTPATTCRDGMEDSIRYMEGQVDSTLSKGGVGRMECSPAWAGGRAVTARTGQGRWSA